MKIPNFLSKVYWLVILITGAVAAATAQSGRTVPEPTKVEAPATINEITKSSDNTPSKQLIDADADQYKLIFPTKYQGDITKSYEKSSLTTSSSRTSFLEELNRAGAQGYKFVAATNNYSAALVKLNEGQYEYRSFETLSDNLYEKVGFSKNHEMLIGQGFHFADHSMLLGYCETPPDSFLEKCSYQDLFLYEKEKHGKPPLPYSEIVSVGGWRKSPSFDMSVEINEKIMDGYLPVAAFSAFEILLQKSLESDALDADKPDVKVVRSLLRRADLDRKVNELAQQGYRLAASTSGIAIMYRHQGDVVPVTYVWLPAKKKSLYKELENLASRGGIYRATYPTDEGDKKTLIFEVPEKTDGKKREYQVLQFDFEVSKSAADGILSRSLTPTAKEAVKTLNKLTRENFVARDIFYSDKASMLLERETQ